MILALALAVSSGSAVQIKEAGISSFKHKSWVQGEYSAEDTIDVTFVLHTCPKKRAALEEKFWAVSNPKSGEYKYLSLEQVADLLHPMREGSEDSWRPTPSRGTYSVDGLVHRRRTTMTKTRDMVRATLNAKAAEAFFGGALSLPAVLRPGLGGRRHRRRARLKHYSLPDEIADKVSHRWLFTDICACAPPLRGKKFAGLVGPRPPPPSPN